MKRLDDTVEAFRRTERDFGATGILHGLEIAKQVVDEEERKADGRQAAEGANTDLKAQIQHLKSELARNGLVPSMKPGDWLDCSDQRNWTWNPPQYPTDCSLADVRRVNRSLKEEIARLKEQLAAAHEQGYRMGSRDKAQEVAALKDKNARLRDELRSAESQVRLMDSCNATIRAIIGADYENLPTLTAIERLVRDAKKAKAKKPCRLCRVLGCGGEQ